MQDKHFDPVREWWADKQPIVVDGFDKARFYTVEELRDLNYDFDKCCPFPHEEEEILEEMFLKVKQDTEGNKIESYLDIINLDESKEKVWSYKCYQEICLISIQFEDHNMFPSYYKKLMDMGRTIDFKYLRPHVESSITLFLNEIFSHSSSSVIIG